MRSRRLEEVPSGSSSLLVVMMDFKIRILKEEEKNKILLKL